MILLGITCGGPDLPARVHAALDAGAEVLVREPVLPAGIPLDRVVLHARMPGAEAVARALHLAADMDVAAVRARFRGRLGASAHSVAEAERKRREGADYVLISPVFAPRHGRPAIGLDAVRGFVALGGVTLERVHACREAGAAGVAAMAAVFGVPGEEAARVRAFVQKLKTSSS